MTHSCRIRSLVCVLLVATIGCGGVLPARADGPGPPKIVLVVAVDQLRRDRLSDELPGGLGRLAREGRVYDRAVLDHAYTATCPGHAVILTGRHPGPAGIPSNSFIEQQNMKLRYCVDDESPATAMFGGTGIGRSPRNLDATGLGDWMKRRYPGSRVFSVSGKDRSAIMMGGQRPDGVYWLDWSGSGSFTTSRYYARALPDWVDRWRRERILEGIPGQWTHATGDPPNGTRKDDFVGEAPRFSRVSPHPLPAPLLDVDPGTAEQELESAARMPPADTTLATLYFSPFLDEVTLRFARELVEVERLGLDEQPDLLAIGLSATDLVGHLYGPWSQESRDALARLDLALGEFIAFLEARVGSDRLLIVLTSDHGVLPLPEALAAGGAATCPVEGGRLSPVELTAQLRAVLVERFGALPQTLADAPELSTPVGTVEAPGWVMRDGMRFTVNRPLAGERGVEVDAIVATASEFLAKQPIVSKVRTPADFDRADDPKAALYRHSHHPDRGGDFVIELHPGCLLSEAPVGTTHGSPHDYDRDVPMVFAGPGVRRGHDAAEVATVDIGPTLAKLLGVEVPEGLDGRALDLDAEPVSAK